ncbi:hypothetical protein CDS [Bradyrhizobium sp.]|nr:hypothetical protein CDS [Bradyrhizobium sp.]
MPPLDFGHCPRRRSAKTNGDCKRGSRAKVSKSHQETSLGPSKRSACASSAI